MSDDLLVKYLLQEASPDESREVEAWIAADAGNDRYFQHFKLLWDTSRGVAAGSTVDEELAWQRFQQRVNDSAPAKVVVVRSVNSRMLTRVAAVLIAGVAIAAMVYLMAPLGKSDKTYVFTTTRTSEVDTLWDGSVVTLNKYSTITYPSSFDGETRTVELKGEGFFNITPDKNKPFIVKVNGLTVKVVGTSFNIRAVNNTTEVIVETGVVEVSNGRETVALQPKEKLETVGTNAPLKKEQSTDQLYKYYRSKEFVCEHTPLWKLVQVINISYDTNIVIASDSLKNLPITAPFYNQSLDQVLQVIEETLGVTVERTNSGILLK